MQNSSIEIDVKPTDPSAPSPAQSGERELQAIIEEARRRTRRRRLVMAATALLAAGVAASAVLLLSGDGGPGETSSRSAADGVAAPGPLLVHRVSCFCAREYVTTTTIHDDGRVVVRFGEDGVLEPSTFQLDSLEVAKIERALASVDFTEQPRRIRQDDADAISDAKALRLTHAGHTVSERTQVRSLDERSASELMRDPPGPLPLVLGPVDELVEEQLDALRERRFGLSDD